MTVVQICHRGAVYVIRKNFVREVLCMTVVRTLSQVLVMTFKEFVTEVLGMTVVRVWHRGAGYNSCKNLVAEVLVMTVVRICHRGAGFVSLNNFVTEVLCMAIIRNLSQSCWVYQS